MGSCNSALSSCRRGQKFKVGSAKKSDTERPLRWQYGFGKRHILCRISVSSATLKACDFPASHPAVAAATNVVQESWHWRERSARSRQGWRGQGKKEGLHNHNQVKQFSAPSGLGVALAGEYQYRMSQNCRKTKAANFPYLTDPNRVMPPCA